MARTKTPANVVGPQIRKLRNKLDLTQDELAARCQLHGLDISHGTLSQIEARLRCVSDVELFQSRRCSKFQPTICSQPPCASRGTNRVPGTELVADVRRREFSPPALRTESTYQPWPLNPAPAAWHRRAGESGSAFAASVFPQASQSGTVAPENESGNAVP